MLNESWLKMFGSQDKWDVRQQWAMKWAFFGKCLCGNENGYLKFEMKPYIIFQPTRNHDIYSSCDCDINAWLAICLLMLVLTDVWHLSPASRTSPYVTWQKISNNGTINSDGQLWTDFVNCAETLQCWMIIIVFCWRFDSNLLLVSGSIDRKSTLIPIIHGCRTDKAISQQMVTHVTAVYMRHVAFMF